MFSYSPLRCAPPATPQAEGDEEVATAQAAAADDSRVRPLRGRAVSRRAARAALPCRVVGGGGGGLFVRGTGVGGGGRAAAAGKGVTYYNPIVRPRRSRPTEQGAMSVCAPCGLAHRWGGALAEVKVGAPLAWGAGVGGGWRAAGVARGRRWRRRAAGVARWRRWKTVRRGMGALAEVDMLARRWGGARAEVDM